MAQSCYNPFDIPGNSWGSRRKNLRLVAAWMCERAPQIFIGSKTCDTCRKKLSKEPPVFIPEPDSPNSDAEAEIYVQTPEVSEIINSSYDTALLN